MKCPHCLVTVHKAFGRSEVGDYAKGRWSIEQMECPECKELILLLMLRELSKTLPRREGKVLDGYQVYPRGSGRAPIPKEVDDAALRADYGEACAVMALSPKAAAALGRRCLQHIMREKANAKAPDLAKEIQQVLDSNKLPSHLAEAIDGVRNIGNFAAHPIKSTSSGEIVDVEPGEAEWTLDTVEELMDFYWVQPARLAAKKAVLNAKLHDAGKPPLKQP